ncbi:MAG: transposase [Patescibacteria group bacterium]
MDIKRKPKHIIVENGIYFITTHTQGFLPIFRNKELIEKLYQNIIKVQKETSFSLFAYVILLNHIHLMFQITKQNILSKIMFRIKGRSAREINKLRGIKGKAVWQDRYMDHLIRDDHDFQNHLDYIHYNPVRHKLVKKPENWPWSSYLKFVRRGYYEIGWGHKELTTKSNFNYEH